MAEAPRILILEDNPADVELIQFELQEAGLAFTSKVVADEREYVKAIEEYCPDLILSDYDLPAYNGALALAEAKRLCPDVPFILVTGAVTENRAIEILTGGAKDFVMKKLLGRLAPAVLRAMEEAEEHKARKAAEKEVREASLYVRSLIESSLDPLVTISADGKIMDVNKATEKVTGVFRDRMIGTDFSDYFTEPDKARAGYEEAFSNGSVKDYPLVIRHTSGQSTEVLYNATTYANEKGEIKGVLAAARDVSQLKKAEKILLAAHENLEKKVKQRTVALEAEIAERSKAEKAIQEAHARTSAVLEGIADAFYSVDDEWRVVMVNPAAERAPFGQPASELLGKVIWELFPALVGTRIQQHYFDAVKKRSMEHYESLSPLNGRWYEVFMYPQEEGLDVYLRDIDERKKAESALQESEGRFRALTETSSLAVGVSSFDGKFLYINKAYEKLFGYTQKELNHLDASELWRNPEDRRKMIDAVRSKDVLMDYEVELKRKGGIPFWAMLSVNSVDYGGNQAIMASVHDITQRKQAEEAISRTQKTFYELVERSPFGTYVIDSHFRIAQMNTSSQTGAFRNVRPVIGRDFTEAMHILWPEPVAAEIIAHFRHTLETGEPYYSPIFINPRHDAEIVESYEWELHRMTLPDGQFGVICYYFDSTKLREAEEALRKSEEQYRSLVRYAPTGIYDIDFATGRFTDVNDAMCQILGYTREELLAMTAFDILDDEGIAHFASRIRQAQSGEQVNKAIEYQVRTKEGRLIWALLSATFHWDGGRIVGATVVAHDITERKKMEEALREIGEKYRNLVKYAPAAIYEMDLSGTKFFSVNDVMCDIIGYSREELLSMKPADLMDEDSRSIFRERIMKKLAGENIDETLEYCVRRKDGEWIHIAVYVGAYTYTDEKPSRVAVIAYDITGRKKTETALEERTRQLENANKELESFSYSVSHDLRAPLRAIDGYTRIILKKQGEQLDEETRQRLQMIKDNTERMGRLIDDLLALSRFGSQAVTKKSLNMEKLISDVWAELLAMHPDRKMTLKNGQMPVAWGDRSLLWQVYSNLMGNAVKFTRGRECALIETGGFVQNGEIVYYVRDNGIGFDMKFSDKLFGAFQRLHGEEEYSGTGIGLALVKRIIQRHDGRVWAEGEVDIGATFYFTLPTQPEYCFHTAPINTPLQS